MSYRKLFIASNALMLAAFVWAFAKDFAAPWRPYQKKYYEMSADVLEKKAAAEKDAKKAADLRAEAKKMRRSPMEIKQIIAGDLGRFDRCVTCHVGMDEYTNPSLVNDFKENPYKSHPKVDAALVKAHPFTKFGCTSCHSGQGLATTVEGAHGWVKHWEKPMLKGASIQGSCVKCHGNFETLKGAEIAAQGKKVFNKHGCQGCHAINGVGGVISVDLGDIADKPFERIAGYNFKKVRIDGKELPNEHHDSHWNIQNWILAHLVNDPAAVTPNDPFAHYNAEPIPPSGMPDYTKEISRADADAVVAYLSGMTKEEVIPYRYHVPGPAPRQTALSGKDVYAKYGCQGCHGLDAKQGRRRFNAAGEGQKEYDEKMPEAEQFEQMNLGIEPTLPNLVGTYTHEELVKKIANGVPATEAKKWSPKGPMPMVYMPAWKDKISKSELDALATWLKSIAKKDDSGF
ncbi:MAG: c-type cytochrome [Elusimicrobiota bacterium]|nr:MAG: c-type cytochrome [Elusimicrobiota bacterium]